MSYSDVTAQAPPSVTVSKKRRSSQESRPSSNKALVPVQVLPERQFAHEGKVINYEDNFAKKAKERYEDQKWNEFLDKNPKFSHIPDEYEELYGEPDIVAVGNFRNMPITQKMKGGRREYYKELRDEWGEPRKRIRVGSNQKVGFTRKSEEKKQKATWTMPSKSKSNKVDEDTAVIDADYENVYDTVPPRDPRNIGFGRAKRVEPDAMKAQAKQKEQMKSKINDFAHSKIQNMEEGSGSLVSVTKRVNNDSLVTPSLSPDASSEKSSKTEPVLVKTRDRIDDAFNVLSDATKGIAGLAKVGAAGIGAGLGAVDAGAKVFGESTIGKNILGQADAYYKHMRSHGKRAAESIKGTGNNSQKSGMTAGSLVTLKQHRTHRGGSSHSSSEPLEIHGFSYKYAKGSHGKVERRWYYHDREVDLKTVEAYLTGDEIKKLRKSADDIFKPNIDAGSLTSSSSDKGTPTVTKNNGTPTLVKNKGTPTLVKKAGYGLVNGTKVATAGGLIKQRTQNTDYSYEPTYNYNNQTIAGIATTKTAGGLTTKNVGGSIVTNKTNAGGIATMKTNSDVVVGNCKTGNIKTTQTATISGINKRKSGGVQADTHTVTPSKINKRKSGGVRTETRPSQLLGKVGNSEKTITAGVVRRTGEIGTTGSVNGIVGNKKQATVGSIITPRRVTGVGAA
jgi:hypothetical protein